MSSGSDPLARELLAELPLFQDLDQVIIDEILRVTEVTWLPGGQVLMRAGEAGDDMYVVRHGRLRAFRVDRSGNETTVGDISAGETIGEMALLSHEPRAVTVRALRDCQLLRFSRAAFERLVSLHPDAGLGIARTVVGRLQRTLRGIHSYRQPTAIAVVAAGGSVLDDKIVRRLAAALGDPSATLLIGAADADAALGIGIAQAGIGDPGEPALVEWLHRVEQTRHRIVYRTDSRATPWTRRCLRQVDQVLLVGTRGADTTPNEVEQLLSRTPEVMNQTETTLILLHPAGTHSPEGTAAWLDPRSVQTHVHVREDSPTDWARLARHLTGRAVGVVLSGGGARGFAHGGVFRALDELHIPVDSIGGVSSGASAAAGFAMGWDWERVLAEHLRLSVEGKSLLDFTVPFLALTRGARMTKRLRRGYLETRIEDLWRGFFAVSTNLSTGRPHIHRRGPLWQAVRASAALPGIFPPVRSAEGHVLVDGGLMNNLPVDIMRDILRGGRVIAVHTEGRIQFKTEDLPEDGIASGWRLWLEHHRPRGRAPRVPRIVHVLTRAAMIGSASAIERQASNADVLLTPPVEDIDLLAFRRYPDAVEAGYRHAMERLSGWTWDSGAANGDLSGP